MKLKILFILLLTLFSCQTEEEKLSYEVKKLRERIDILKSEERSAYVSLEEVKARLSQKRELLPEEDKIYVVLIQIKQSRTLGILDLENSIKDEMNKISIPVEVSKNFYDSHKKGDKIKSDFRYGSFILKGSMSSWNITIKEKKIAYKH